MERKLFRTIGLTLALGVGTVACGYGESYEVTSCGKLDHKVKVTMGSGNENDPKALIKYNTDLPAEQRIEEDNTDVGDYVDKLGEAVCYDPQNTDDFYFTNSGWKLR